MLPCLASLGFSAPSLTVAVDLSFGASMNLRERRSLAKQLQQIIGSNRHFAHPLELHFTSFEKAREEPVCLPRDEDQLRAWRRIDTLTLHDDAATSVWRPEDLVYLSPDATTPLLSLDPRCVYVIGGIVDRQVDKGLSLDRATELGSVARRLPIREYAERPDAHPIMNVDACVQILGDVHNGATWQEAIARSLPRRHLKVRELEDAQGRKDRVLESDGGS